MAAGCGCCRQSNAVQMQRVPLPAAATCQRSLLCGVPWHRKLQLSTTRLEVDHGQVLAARANWNQAKKALRRHAADLAPWALTVLAS